MPRWWRRERRRRSTFGAPSGRWGRHGGGRGLRWLLGSLTALAVLAGSGVLLLTACSEMSRLPPGSDAGTAPRIGEPARTLLPTVRLAPAEPWAPGQRPLPATGLRVEAFATGLNHPRGLLVLPQGDVLVAEARAPRHEGGFSLQRWLFDIGKARAGHGGESPDRITLLRDTDGDGVAETREPLLQGLRSPTGLAFVPGPGGLGGTLYVAATDALWAWPFTPGQTRLSREAGRRVAALPAGPRNLHWTRALTASPDGTRLFVGVGADSNIAEHGLAAEAGRAMVQVVEAASGASRPWATGLRNPTGLAWLPGPDGAPRLWAVVMERDGLGSDLPPDLLTAVDEGAHYGWPWRWWDGRVDGRVDPPTGGWADAAARVRRPDYALGAHVSPLGLADSGASSVPGAMLQAADLPRLGRGVFVALHGSWNRAPPAGYRVVYVPFVEGRPTGPPLTVLEGFLSPEGRARGRPAVVAVDGRGALLVGDDVGGTIWRVRPR